MDSKATIILQEMQKEWYDTLGLCNKLGVGIEESDLALLSLSAIATLTHDRYVLAVAGHQGVGKTTAVKQLYELDGGFLPETIGRGEKLPILVTESSSVSEPLGFVFRIWREGDGDLKKEHVPVLAERFLKRSRNPENGDVYMELLVPSRYFPEEQVSIALLPGFEDGKPQPFQLLVDQMLYAASGCVVVVPVDGFAQQTHIDVGRRLTELFGDFSPVFLLTHGDLNPAANEVIRDKLCREMDLHPDQCIVTGVPPFPQEWRAALVDAIGKHVMTKAEVRGKASDALGKLARDFQKNVDRLQQRAETIALSLFGSSILHSYTHELMPVFDQERERLTRDVREDLTNVLEQRRTKAGRRLDKVIVEHEDLWQRITYPFGRNPMKHKAFLNDAIYRAWDGDNTSTMAIGAVLTGIADKHYQRLLGRSAQTRIEFMTQQLAERNPVRDRLVRYFQGAKDVQLTVDDMKILALMPITLAELALPIVMLDAVQSESDHPKNVVMDDLKDIAGAAAGTFKVLLPVMAAVLGVDGLDGNLQHVPSVLDALGVTGAQALGVLGVGFSLVVAWRAIGRAVQDTYSVQVQLSEVGQKALEQFPDLQLRAVVKSIDTLYDRLRTQITEEGFRRGGGFDGRAEIVALRNHLREMGNLSGELANISLAHRPVIS